MLIANTMESRQAAAVDALYAVHLDTDTPH